MSSDDASEVSETRSARQKRERRSQSARLTAQARIESLGLPDNAHMCGRYGGRTHGGKSCENRAGWNTPHQGTGPCWLHGGLRRDELAVGAWVMGHALAKPLDISPWDALLGEVKRTAGKVAWLDWKLGTFGDDAEFVGDGQAVPWVKMQEKERNWLGRVSKMAIDAGVAAIMVQQVQVEAQTIARVLTAALDALGLNEEQEMVARAALRRELATLDAERLGIQEAVAGVDYQGEVQDV